MYRFQKSPTAASRTAGSASSGVRLPRGNGSASGSNFGGRLAASRSWWPTQWWPSAEGFGIAVVLAAVLTEWFSDWTFAYAAAPINVGLITLAMAHGAADADRIRRDQRGRVASLSWYLAILAIAAWLLFAAPLIVLSCFLVLSAWHFGRDAWESRQARGVAMCRGTRASLTATRGLLVIVLPVLLYPRPALEFLALASGSVDRTFAVEDYLRVWPLTGGTARLLMVVAVSLCLLGLHALFLWRSRRATAGNKAWWWRVAAEHLVLFAGAVMLHPLFFIGLYLGGWHALMHIRDLPAPHRGADRGWSLLATMAFLLPVLAVVLTAWAWSPSFPGWENLKPIDLVRGDAALQLAALVLLSYAVVTWPHAWLEVRRGDAPAGDV